MKPCVSSPFSTEVVTLPVCPTLTFVPAVKPFVPPLRNLRRSKSKQVFVYDVVRSQGSFSFCPRIPLNLRHRSDL